MKSRKEVVEFIDKQFALYESDYGIRIDRKSPRKPDAWHYGLVDLRELLDFLYGGPPTNDDEKLNFRDN